jgi:hypothetical protein
MGTTHEAVEDKKCSKSIELWEEDEGVSDQCSFGQTPRGLAGLDKLML